MPKKYSILLINKYFSRYRYNNYNRYTTVKMNEGSSSKVL